MKEYENSWWDMNIFQGNWQTVQEKLWSSGNDKLLQIKQQLWMMTADYIRSISGTAASDKEVDRLISLLPKTTDTFDKAIFLSDWFKTRVINQVENALKNTMWKNKDMIYDTFPELATKSSQVSSQSSIGTSRR